MEHPDTSPSRYSLLLVVSLFIFVSSEIELVPIRTNWFGLYLSR
jgi:hypothetical protein